MAERVGLAPTVRFPVRSLSRRVLSTAQPPLRSGRSTAYFNREMKWGLCPHAWKKYRLSAFSKERLEDGGAFGGQDAGGDFYLMVEARMRQDFETGADSAALGVVSAVDQARDAGLEDGAGRHAAGFDGSVESGTGEAVISEKAGGFAKDDDFGVGRGVVVAIGAVVRTRKSLSIMDEHSANGNFAGFCSDARFG